MALKVVNRERELEQLQRLASAPPALVVLYGRRRVGKSFLLRVALTGERVVSLQAEQKPLPLQLDEFARECSRLLPGSPPLAFSSWSEALTFLEGQAVAGGPLTAVLDEFQYLADSDTALESTIQRFWDRWDREQIPILLVLAGSALSFMEGLLGGRQATFGRSVYRPLLKPLNFRDSSAFAPRGTTAIGMIERYGVIGGTPQYQRWAGERPLDEVISESVLPPDASLHSDPEHLIREEGDIREPGPYFGALEAIANGQTTPTAIGGRIQMKSQAVDRILRRLEELGYLAKVEPLEPGGKGSSRAYWKISDPYFRFWFQFVFANRSRLARGRIKEVAREITRDLPTFLGPIFEDCCREWVGSYSDLGANALEVGSWWSRKSDTEIDVVALDKNGYTLLAAGKWWEAEVGVNVLDDLYNARSVIGPKAAQARLAIFSKLGFTEPLRERAEAEGVALIEPADLFR